jgi:hypothetical protein
MVLRLHGYQHLGTCGVGDMVTYAALAAIVLFVTGCAPTDQLNQIMGRTEGTPTSAPQQLDCDLIFPAPSKDTLAP